MSYETLLSVFLGTTLVATGLIALGAGVVLGSFGNSEHRRRFFDAADGRHRDSRRYIVNVRHVMRR